TTSAPAATPPGGAPRAATAGAPGRALCPIGARREDGFEDARAAAAGADPNAVSERAGPRDRSAADDRSAQARRTAGAAAAGTCARGCPTGAQAAAAAKAGDTQGDDQEKANGGGGWTSTRRTGHGRRYLSQPGHGEDPGALS